MYDEVETQRLILRQWRPEDFEAYAAYYADPELARFVGGRSTREAAWRRLASLIPRSGSRNAWAPSRRKSSSCWTTDPTGCIDTRSPPTPDR